MSRLVQATSVRGSAPAIGSPHAPEGYVERVAKYIPGEVVAAYVSLVGLVPLARGEKLQLILYVVVFAAGLVATPLYLGAAAAPGEPRRTHLVISSIAFVIWAYTLGGVFKALGLHEPVTGAVALVLFTLFAGRFVPAPPAAAASLAR